MDFLTDNSNVVFEALFASQNEQLGLAKQASSSSAVSTLKEEMTKKAASYPLQAFADTARREYPMVEPSEVVLGLLHARHARNGNSRVEPLLSKKASAMGFSDTVEILEKILINMGDEEVGIKKAASSSSDEGETQYALQFRGKNYYPCDTAYHVEESAQRLDRDFGKLPVVLFRHAAQNLCKRASVLGVDQPRRFTARVLTHGHPRIVSEEGIKLTEQLRRNVYNDKSSHALDVILKQASKCDTIQGVDTAEYLAGQIEILDAANGLRYDHVTPDPYTTLFTGPSVEFVKQASSQLVAVRRAGDAEEPSFRVVTMSDVKNVQYDDDWSSDSFRNGMEKVAKAESNEDVSRIINTEMDDHAREALLSLIPEEDEG